MADQSLQFTLDEALSATGFGNFQGLVLVYAGLGWISEAMEILLLSLVGPAVQSEWGISPSEESLLSTVVFAGMLFGAYIWGSVSDIYGRRIGFLGAMISTAVPGFLSAFSPNYTSLLILRFLLGVGVGGGHVFSSWFLEFAPVHNRGAWMMSLTAFWSLGTVIEALLGWIIMPRMGWRWLLALSSVPSFLVLAFGCLAPESPRYLCMKGRTTEAQELLEKVAQLNGTKLPSGVLVLRQLVEQDEEYLSSHEETSLLSPAIKDTNLFKTSLSSVRALFSPKLLYTTLLLWFQYFGGTFAYYGIILMTTELSSQRSTCTSHSSQLEDTKDELYLDLFLTSLAELPAIIFPAIILDRVGRKLTMGITSTLGFIFLLPLLWQQNEMVTTTLLFGTRLFVSATFDVVCLYSREAYPTSVRTTGAGTATSVARIGGMVCPLVAVGLIRGCHQTAAVMLFEVTVVLVGLSVALLPIETKGRELMDVTGD